MGEGRDDREDDGSEAKVRLFLAVDIPPSAKDAADTAFEPWRLAFPRGRWIPPENWHLTLKFLGWTRPGVVPWVGEQVETIVTDVSPFSIRVVATGAYPSTRRARVLWAGVSGDAGSLGSLAEALDAAVSARFSPETRPFSAHLTLGRADPPIRLPETYEATALASEPWRVEHVCLFRSHLGRPFPRYERLRRFSLGK